MATKISICNTALILVGAAEITAFEDATREAKVCAALYEETVQDLLTQNWWRFSMGQASLSKLADKPLFGFTNAFQLPPASLRVQSTEFGNKYEVYEDMLFSNEDTIKITYQFRPVEAKFPVYFIRALELELAVLFAAAIPRDESKVALFEKLSVKKTAKAKTIDSQLQPNQAIRHGNFSLVTARL